MKFEELVRTIRPALDVFIEDEAIAELRVPQSKNGPQSGLFDDLGKMAEAAAKMNGKAPGIYFTLNPVSRSLKGQVKNRLVKASSAVSDADIDHRRWLLLDFDPVRRPSKSPSTDAEREAAIAIAKECRESLRTLGWPEPVLASSGNGSYLLYRISLANNKQSDEVVRNCLATLALWFSTGVVTLDSGVGNASRLARVLGTMNCKGKETDGRPYRRARLLEVPDEIDTVSAERLAQVGATLPAAPTKKIGQQLDVARWIKKFDVPIAFDAEWNSGHKWVLRECPWDESHKKSAFIVRFQNGGVAAGCLHKSCSGKNWPKLRGVFEKKSETTPDLTPSSTASVREQKASQGSDLIQLASPKVKLFRTLQGEAYSTIAFETHEEHHAVGSSAFRDYMNRQYFQKTKTAPQPAAVSQAVCHFSAVARFDSSTEPIFIRVGKTGDLNFLDLANDRWEAVEFGADGWRIVEKPLIRFRRAKGMLPLPRPERGGDINDLRECLNFGTDEDWVLFLTGLINAICAAGPYAILGINGEAGSGKTTTARVHRKMVDPNASPARSTPKDERDLMVTANNSWVMCFDNLSFIPAWLSDSFCRLSTGGGISRRSLYTDADEFIFDGQRPIVFNGIEELATRTDLLDRCVILDLPVIQKYVAETDFWNKFDAAYPRLLGALLDLAVGVLRNLPKVNLLEQPRMADFARIGTAAESEMGLRRGTFMRAYNLNRRNATAVALEACPFAPQVLELAKKGWQGAPTDLLRALEGMVDDETRSRRSWPKTANVLSGKLKQLAPALRRTRVEVISGRDETRSRNRTILIRELRSEAKR